MARAPEGLRADVMQHVHAEPRRRPVRGFRPRSYARPLAAAAAAACIVAASVVGASHLSGSSSSAGAGAAGGTPGASRAPSLETAGPKAPTPVTTTGPVRFDGVHAQTVNGLTAGRWLARTPLPLRRAYAGRAALAGPLPRALEPYGPTGRGTHGR